MEQAGHSITSDRSEQLMQLQ